MKDYGTVKSTVKPETMVIDDYSVWINSDIEEIAENLGESVFTGYKYSAKRYTKNEYIALLNEQLTDTQLALCDIYEQIANS